MTAKWKLLGSKLDIQSINRNVAAIYCYLLNFELDIEGVFLAQMNVFMFCSDRQDGRFTSC